MPHALTANVGISYFDVTLVTDLPLEAFSLELAATALETLGGPEDNLAEQSVRLRFATSIVKRLSFGDLSVRPAAYFLR
jgi:hypothetical protein